MHAALAQPVSTKFDLAGETSGERAVGRRVPNMPSFDSLLQATEPAAGSIKPSRRGNLPTPATLPSDARAIFAGRENRDTHLAEPEVKRNDEDDDTGWTAISAGEARDAAGARPSSDEPAADADDEPAAATFASATMAATDQENAAEAAALASLLIGVPASTPVADDPRGAVAVTAATPMGFPAEQAHAHALIGQTPSLPPAETAPAPGGDNQITATVQGAGDSLSSRPSSLLVPQAVLAEATQTSASGDPGHPAPAATGPGVNAASTVGAVAQASRSTEGPAPQPAGSAVSPAPDEAATPSPIAVAAAPASADAGDGDLPQGEQGFSAAAGGHALAARDKGMRPLASKAVAAQVGAQIGKAAKIGLTRIDIALEPASLGKIEVRLDFGRDGRIAALFVAESREALDALRADARTLERALSEAGVKTDSASLDFSLRERGTGSGAFSDRYTGGGSRSVMGGAGELEAETTLTSNPPTLPSGDRRLDIRA